MAKIEQITKFDGILLTPEAINWLKTLQDGNNNMIINYRDLLGDVISYFGREIHIGDTNEPEDIEFKRFINELSFLRRDLKDLSKP
jgi:hypothetical protein